MKLFLIPEDSPPQGETTALGQGTKPRQTDEGQKVETMQSIANLVSKQRQLVADMDTPEQVSTLHSLIKNPPQNSRVVQFSPELALYILENLNVGNRSQKPRQIRNYAKDMTDNNWSLTGQPIVFGNHGQLLDGQNRLSACVRADVPFTTHAVFGVDNKSFVHFDIGKNRNSTDVFTIMKVPYPRETGLTVRLLEAWNNGKTSTRGVQMSNDDLRKYYSGLDEKVLELAIKSAKKVNQTTSYPIAHLATLFYIVAKKNDMETVKSFLNDLATGFGKGPRSPVRYLLETIVKHKMDKTTTLTSDMYTILLIRTWNNYKLGKASVMKDMRIRIGDPMPDIL